MRKRLWGPGVTPAEAGRCARCRHHLARCVCAAIPTLTTTTELLVIRHVAERWKPSNTAHHAALALPALRVVEYGDQAAPLDSAELSLPGSFLLYPDGPPLDPAAAPTVRRLIVLDGTWPQARHMLQRTPALRALPRLSLPVPTEPRARIRRPHQVAHMSTLEAIAAALRLIEGPRGPALADALDALHDLLVDRALAGRTVSR